MTSSLVRKGPMSALGHKRTFALQNVMSPLPPIATAKADSPANGHFRITPESGHVRCISPCPLSANSGLLHCSRSLFDNLIGPLQE